MRLRILASVIYLFICSIFKDDFHPQVIYKHGETWWNDIDWEKLLIRLPELSDIPTSRVNL
jgi:hypothetical protein